MKKSVSFLLVVIMFITPFIILAEEYDTFTTHGFIYQIPKGWSSKTGINSMIYYYAGEVGDVTDGYISVRISEISKIDRKTFTILYPNIMEGYRKEMKKLPTNQLFEETITIDGYDGYIFNSNFLKNETAYPYVVLLLYRDGYVFQMTYSRANNFSTKASWYAEAKNFVNIVSVEKEELINLWYVDHYLDDFGDETDKQYMTQNGIDGDFSNSATQNSDLFVKLFVENNKKIKFKMYEYGEDGYLVDAYKKTKYEISIKLPNGKTTKLVGHITTDELVLDASNSQKLHKLFLEHDNLSFFIQNMRHKNSTYRFSIQTFGYEEIYNNLISK